MVILESPSTTTNTVIIVLCRRKGRHIVHKFGFPRLVGGKQRGVHALLLNGWFGDGVSNERYDIFVNIMSKFKMLCYSIVMCLPYQLGMLA